MLMKMGGKVGIAVWDKNIKDVPVPTIWKPKSFPPANHTKKLIWGHYFGGAYINPKQNAISRHWLKIRFVTNEPDKLLILWCQEFVMTCLNMESKRQL